jgi:PAS domain S-box-containing protein
MAPGPISTMGAPVEQLELATVTRLSQAVSDEIVLEKVIDVVLRSAVAQAGAGRGLLILPSGAEPRLAAEAATEGDRVVVQLADRPVTSDLLPLSVLQHVLRTGENTILDDAGIHPSFAGDPYVRARRVRSVLCLPLVSQGKLRGVLYLENNLVSRAFAADRIAPLKLIASRAAVTLENARLVRDLEQREAKIKRLVDANIIGIFIWSHGVIIEANDTFLHMLGFDREDLVAGRIRWLNQTPTEWHDVQARAEEELARTGTSQPFEKEYFRKDGSRIPVLIGSALFQGYGSARTGVSFVLDLSARKRAEAEARDSEQRYRDLQAEMAHASRVSTMGQITASIAHEVRQPITAVITNATAALRWLNRDTPNLEEAREGLRRIVSDGHRAGDVMSRISDLVKKAPSRRDDVDINAAIQEVIELTRSEATKNGLAVQAELKDGLPTIKGDRVQLQQVVLNLVVNGLQALETTADGPRTLSVATAGSEPDGVLVAVTDTGVGLSAAELERVFDPFYTTKADGLGMGLSICRSIVRAHGGRLWVTANQPRGAVFQFTVPGGKSGDS